MINYKKYELMVECLVKTFEVYAGTLDVADYVPATHVEKIHKWIFKNMKKKQRQIDKEDRKYQKSLRELVKFGDLPDTTSKETVMLDMQDFVKSSSEQLKSLFSKVEELVKLYAKKQSEALTSDTAVNSTAVDSHLEANSDSENTQSENGGENNE